MEGCSKIELNCFGYFLCTQSANRLSENYGSKMTLVGPLDAENFDNPVLLYVFRIAFPFDTTAFFPSANLLLN